MKDSQIKRKYGTETNSNQLNLMMEFGLFILNIKQFLVGNLVHNTSNKFSLNIDLKRRLILIFCF